MCHHAVPGPQGNDTGGDSHTTFYIMMAWIVIAFVLYLLRLVSTYCFSPVQVTKHDDCVEARSVAMFISVVSGSNEKFYNVLSNIHYLNLLIIEVDLSHKMSEFLEWHGNILCVLN